MTEVISTFFVVTGVLVFLALAAAAVRVGWDTMGLFTRKALNVTNTYIHTKGVEK